VFARGLITVGHGSAVITAVLLAGLDRAGTRSVGTLGKLRELVWNVGLNFLHGVHLPILAV
jgi:hypothetical protein